MEDKLTIKLSAVLDEDSINEIRKMIKEMVTEEVAKAIKAIPVPYPITYVPHVTYTYPVYTTDKVTIPNKVEITCNVNNANSGVEKLVDGLKSRGLGCSFR